eukprot:2095481-Prymnesium_polylepis.1
MCSEVNHSVHHQPPAQSQWEVCPFAFALVPRVVGASSIRLSLGPVWAPADPRVRLPGVALVCDCCVLTRIMLMGAARPVRHGATRGPLRVGRGGLNFTGYHAALSGFT